MAGRPTKKRTCAPPVTVRAMPENEIPPATRVDIYSMIFALGAGIAFSVNWPEAMNCPLGINAPAAHRDYSLLSFQYSLNISPAFYAVFAEAAADGKKRILDFLYFLVLSRVTEEVFLNGDAVAFKIYRPYAYRAQRQMPLI